MSNGVSANTSRTVNCAHADKCQYIPNRPISPGSPGWAADNPLPGSVVGCSAHAAASSGPCPCPHRLRRGPAAGARPPPRPGLTAHRHRAGARAPSAVDQPTTRPLARRELPSQRPGPPPRRRFPPGCPVRPQRSRVTRPPLPHSVPAGVLKARPDRPVPRPSRSDVSGLFRGTSGKPTPGCGPQERCQRRRTAAFARDCQNPIRIFREPSARPRVYQGLDHSRQ